MDRSFLSRADVVEAAQNFVCVRLATYESASEGALMESLFRSRSGKLENSLFVLLALDGKTKLSRAGRSPRFIFRTPQEMALELREIAARYDSKKTTPALPKMANLRLGLNVAACDGLPLVVAVAKDQSQQRRMEKRLAREVWQGGLGGRAVYASALCGEELESLGVKPEVGYLVISPDEYGLRGEMVAKVGADVRGATFSRQLSEGVSQWKKNRRRKRIHHHVQDGKSTGKHWETVIPVTDPGPPPRHRPPREHPLHARPPHESPLQD